MSHLPIDLIDIFIMNTKMLFSSMLYAYIHIYTYKYIYLQKIKLNLFNTNIAIHICDWMVYYGF